MDIAAFEVCLGKSQDAPEVWQLLATLKIEQETIRPTAEGYIRIKLPERGLLISFKPEDEKSSKMKLSGVQFYSDAEAGFTSYVGSLPSGIMLSDTRDVCIAKVGQPTESIEKYRIDNWVRDGRLLSVQYRKDGKGIASVLVGFPRAEKK